MENECEQITDKSTIRQKRKSSSLTVPSILCEKNILVPIKVDLTHGGARFVDSFCWNISNKSTTPEELAARTCADLNLVPAFQPKIALQISEQIESFSTIIDLVKLAIHGDAPFAYKIKERILMNLSLRHSVVEYSDKFYWDPMCRKVTPEKFARLTCADLGLPANMEPMIAFKIREMLFRNMICWLEDPKLIENLHSMDNFQFITAPAEIKVSLAPSSQTIDMPINLWKKAKPGSIEDQLYAPAPIMSIDKETNASVWKCKEIS